MTPDEINAFIGRIPKIKELVNSGTIHYSHIVEALSVIKAQQAELAELRLKLKQANEAYDEDGFTASANQMDLIKERDELRRAVVAADVMAKILIDFQSPKIWLERHAATITRAREALCKEEGK